MVHRRTRGLLNAVLIAAALVVALPVNSLAQTFRGGISGTVTDQSGAVVSGAQVTAVETATNTLYKTVSSSAGEFAFANMPVSSYTVTVSASGFKSIKVDKVPVTAASRTRCPSSSVSPATEKRSKLRPIL